MIISGEACDHTLFDERYRAELHRVTIQVMVESHERRTCPKFRLTRTEPSLMNDDKVLFREL